MSKTEFIENVHYYLENGKIIMTERYHMDRGFCCGNKCKHCCFLPKYTKGVTLIDEEFQSKKQEKNQ